MREGMNLRSVSRWPLRTCTAIGLLTFFSGASLVSAQQTDAEKLSRALREIEALKARLAEVEGIVRQHTASVTTNTMAPRQPANQASIEESLSKSGFVKWNELSVGKTSRFKLYGFLRLDAIYDDSRPNNTQIPAFIRSEDPTAPAAIMSERNTDDFTIHPRLTRFGIDLAGPNVALLGGASTSGKLEIDFYNLPSSESRNAPRILMGI